MPDDLKDLYARRALCLFCIQTVSETPLDDPRREGAIKEYNDQLAKIDARIAAITGKPPDIVIGLKPAILFPKAACLPMTDEANGTSRQEGINK